MLHTQFSELRRHFVSNFVEDRSQVVVNSRLEAINTYLYYKEKNSVIILVNATLDNYEEIKFFVKGVDFNKVIIIKKDGQEQSVKFNYDDGIVMLDCELPYMSTLTLRLVKE